ncbi:hypothetical protein A3207_02875 [Candidatus Methanomassiliicoccus intestinalis]|jgi:hypothetical protein|uniref:Uncharacterized protein n=2 Tax=Candidatus Methanomassiliicoccus intestinalis TaxID=1406512 RepID=R9TAS8_METII|nr:hypothetical protein MMINT_14645 [Candidatus Methanomassiliicoccus intestinalis Issoire-Mx1]TQS82902.1 MAG: hypothetical protein A3207_02875 [Candidatus Methanomassiliicoccus intestinalis]TQS83757.1 MAG: hypothetical protein A3206_02710 [Candidatus Methanomassiliicoccus intestinalis]
MAQIVLHLLDIDITAYTKRRTKVENMPGNCLSIEGHGHIYSLVRTYQLYADKLIQIWKMQKKKE